jgi:small subunit ribosomal protein S6
MQIKNYETVIILTPVLSEAQTKDAVEKFKKVLTDQGCELINDENWGLKSLAYPIKGKSTGFYALIEFKGKSSSVSVLETEYRRDERVLRFLTTTLDKYAVQYNEKRRSGAFEKNKPVREVAA